MSSQEPTEFRARVQALTLSLAIHRGLRLRCPICGEGKLFAGAFRMNLHCAGCGFRFERAPGYFLGSTYINYGVTTISTTIVYVVAHFGFRIGNLWVVPALAAFSLIFPAVFFRVARSLWLAVDCVFDKTGACEHSPDAAEGLQRKS